MSDVTIAGEVPQPAQDADTTPLEGAQDPTQDAGTGTEEQTTDGLVGTLSGLQDSQHQAVETIDALPKWARSLIKDLRSENASHRKAKKQAETEAEKATREAAEEKGEYKKLYETELAKREAAEAQAKELELDVLKSKVATEVGLPQQLASRLAGETEDEIKADAQAVLAALPKSTIGNDAQQGTGTSGQPIQMSDEEIQEFAARYGVDAKYVKPEYFRIKK